MGTLIKIIQIVVAIIFSLLGWKDADARQPTLPAEATKHIYQADAMHTTLSAEPITKWSEKSIDANEYTSVAGI